MLALLTSQRCQTIRKFQIDFINLTDEKCTFFINSVLKHSRKGHHQKPIELLAFSDNRTICVIDLLKEHIERTKNLREAVNTKKLLISFRKPFKAISKDTLSRWIKTVLRLAGIDTSIFTAHSTRAASTSATSKAGLPIADILGAAGWSQATIFTTFYKKQLKQNFGQILLDSYPKPASGN